MAVSEPKKGKSLPSETLSAVKMFYHDEEYSRQLPGKKDFVSVSKNVHVQKRLILCNLKELHSAFKSKHPTLQVGFSKFCSLRPKWCIVAGASGTHSVCVCTIHQNIKLLLSPINLNYKDLLKFIVCDLDKKECMVKRCPQCPATTDSLIEQLKTTIGEFEEDDTIEFSQWTTTDRSTLVQQQETVPDYIKLVVSQLQKLTSHSYVAKCQTSHLKKRKEELDGSVALILGDFAENYKFVVQDEVQSFHWNNLQCTLHPVVVYYRADGKLLHMSYCIISDDMTHDVAMVYEIQKCIIAAIKSKLPYIVKVEYYSDGCAGQYKNCKKFFQFMPTQSRF